MIYKRIVSAIFTFSFCSLLWVFLKTTIVSIKRTPLTPEGTQTYYGQQNFHLHLGTHLPMPLKLKGKRLPFHRIYEPRQVGAYQKLSHEIRVSNKSKVILLWTTWNSIRKTINYYFLRSGNKSFTRHNCPIANCEATDDRARLPEADVVLFHLLDTKAEDLPPLRRSNQTWILYNMEPPWLISRHHDHKKMEALDNLFNYTMSYRTDSDIKASYGQVLALDRAEDQMNAANYSQVFARKRGSVVWFVSDCKTDSKRELYVAELKKHIDVDVYGLCGDHKCFPAQSSACYDDVLAKYKFYLSFENAICKDYVTEKFFNVYNYDIIPVVFGGAGYSDIAPEGSFIDANEYPQPHVLAKHLIEIGSNETRFTSMLMRKQSFTAVLDPWICRLCDKLHTKMQQNVLRNVEQWWIEKAKCRTWSNAQKVFIPSIIK